MKKNKNFSKQFNIRYNYEKNILNNYVKNIINMDYILPKELYYILKINYKKNSSISNTHSICQFSKRSRANFNKYKISRMVFRKYGENGYLNGLRNKIVYN